MAQAIDATGCGKGWTEDDYAHGKAYKFCLPDGHGMKILWDLDYFKRRARPGAASCATGLRRRPLRGVPVRRIDHVNIMVKDVIRQPRFHGRADGFQSTRGENRHGRSARLAPG